MQLKSDNVFEIPSDFYQFDWDNSDITEEIIENSKNFVQTCVNKIDNEFDDILSYVRIIKLFFIGYYRRNTRIK